MGCSLAQILIPCTVPFGWWLEKSRKSFQALKVFEAQRGDARAARYCDVLLVTLKSGRLRPSLASG